MNVRIIAAILAIGAGLISVPPTDAVTIDTVAVASPGNAGQDQPQGTFGAVSYPYRIGKTEVSNSQYVEFLNAVAKTDPFGLFSIGMSNDTRGGIVRNGSPGSYSYAVKLTAVGKGPDGSDYGYANKPVIFVSLYDALRFANWLHNGQGSGSTESGAYSLLGGTLEPSNGESIIRNLSAIWFLPDEDEWFKAAYYDGSSGTYYENATGSAIHPNSNLPSADTGNSANFAGSEYATGSELYSLTDVGAYSKSDSPNGTFDQAGNVSEWVETLLYGDLRIRRGGSWANSDIQSQHRSWQSPTNQDRFTGFRVATIAVPEPSTFLLAIACFIYLQARRGRAFNLVANQSGHSTFP